ncbi:hypothetical protein F0M18_03330 [Pseudohalioglobus sediminis]|uniref:Tetratricopeptide repeat protein n=1 Tax=Pseudohalioglobus sediminis TaxID=2606449 RepID=A0A5B0X749_9GAMM|nr:hypothetical protein [Pseudohalioglobus sediminis]KAA1194475.1 hypothetical protein F0M18_03330 [Pseudohalioglobus sediminis]
MLPGLLAITAALYWSGLSGPFLFDDGPALTGNAYLTFDAGVFDQWRLATFSSDSGPLQRPLAMWSFAVNSVLAGGWDAFQVKLGNLLIHLACGCLVYLFAGVVVSRATNNLDRAGCNRVALLAAALWLLAPLHVSTVLYAVQRMAQLATLFTLAGLVLFVLRRERWAERGASTGELVATSMWLGLLLLLAAFSKENGVLLLWLLPVVEVTLYRGRWAGGHSRVVHMLGWAGVLVPVVLLVAATWLVPEFVQNRYAWREFTLQERLLTQLRLLWQYLYWLVFPDINAMGFQHDDIALSRSWSDPWTTWLAALAWLCAALLAWLARHHFPLLGFALLFYLVGHAMESSVWPLEMVYEHRSYLPSVGVFIALAVLLHTLLSRQQLVRPGLVSIVVVLVVATLLFLRVQVWSEPLRLSAVNVANHPDSSRSRYFLAESYLKRYRKLSASEPPAEDAGQYLVAARHEFEVMYQKNPRDFAALVMLYYLDSYHFRELQAYNDWFSKLQDVAATRALQASDRVALDVLLDCFEEKACDASPQQVGSLLDLLQSRYPGNVGLTLLRYRYLRSVDAPVQQRQTLLSDAHRARPGNLEVYPYYLGELAAVGDVSGVYEGIRQWLQYDRKQRHLGVISGVFAEPVGEASE